MKECKYCGTKYDDYLSECPSCGSTVVITLEEMQAEQVRIEEDSAYRMAEKTKIDPHIKIIRTITMIVVFLLVVFLASCNTVKDVQYIPSEIVMTVQETGGSAVITYRLFPEDNQLRIVVRAYGSYHDEMMLGLVEYNDNTNTIIFKGAEIRLDERISGLKELFPDGFINVFDDGEVSVDDKMFFSMDLDEFNEWYDESGTELVKYDDKYITIFSQGDPYDNEELVCFDKSINRILFRNSAGGYYRTQYQFDNNGNCTGYYIFEGVNKIIFLCDEEYDDAGIISTHTERSNLSSAESVGGDMISQDTFVSRKYDRDDHLWQLTAESNSIFHSGTTQRQIREIGYFDYIECKNEREKDKLIALLMPYYFSDDLIFSFLN